MKTVTHKTQITFTAKISTAVTRCDDTGLATILVGDKLIAKTRPNVRTGKYALSVPMGVTFAHVTGSELIALVGNKVIKWILQETDE